MGQRFDPSRPPPCTRCRDERNGSIHHDPDIPYHHTLLRGCERYNKPTLRFLGVDFSSPSACGPRKWPAWSGLPWVPWLGTTWRRLTMNAVGFGVWIDQGPTGLTCKLPGNMGIEKNDNSRELHPPGLTALCIYPREYQVPASLDGRVPPARLPTEPANQSSES